MIAHFRCYKCDTLLPLGETQCACGGGAGPTFGLRFDASPGQPPTADPASPADGPAPKSITPPADARRIRAGTRLSGELLLRTPDWEREGVVTLELLCVARGDQKSSSTVHHHLTVKLAANPLAEHGRWPFAFDVPRFPTSHEGFVEIDWYLRATLTPTKGRDTTWTWQLYVLPGAGTPPLARIANLLAFVRAWLREAYDLGVKLVAIAVWIGALVLPVATGELQWLLMTVPICAYFAWLGRDWLGPTLRWARAWLEGALLPRPAVPRVLRLGQTASVRLDPRYDWSFTRVEEQLKYVTYSGGSRPVLVSRWPDVATRFAGGEGSGTFTVPIDATPSIALATRRIRWEVRVWPRGNPDIWRASYVEVLAAYAPGVEPPSGAAAA